MNIFQKKNKLIRESEKGVRNQTVWSSVMLKHPVVVAVNLIHVFKMQPVITVTYVNT